MRANFPGVYARAYASMTQNAQSSRPASSGVFSGFVSENQYTATVYDTPVVMLNRVRLAMGDSALYAALQDYYTTFRFKRVHPSDSGDASGKP